MRLMRECELLLKTNRQPVTISPPEKYAPKAEVIKTFLLTYALDVGDQSPVKDVIYLPNYFKWTEVYTEFNTKFPNTAGYRYFMKIKDLFSTLLKEYAQTPIAVHSV